MSSQTYTEPSVDTQNKIINLAKNILTHYENLENLLEFTTRSQNQINNYIYYCHSEFDSNTTEFESLSNANKIVLKTKLNKKYVPGIMRLFQCIYDNNYWIFEDNSWFGATYDDSEINLDQNTVQSLLTYENVNEWIQVFDKFNELEGDESEQCDENNNFIGNERIYEEIPNVDNSYTNIRKRQKIYTLSDIKRLLEE
jgi:hypothetical protein